MHGHVKNHLTRLYSAGLASCAGLRVKRALATRTGAVGECLKKGMECYQSVHTLASDTHEHLSHLASLAHFADFAASRTHAGNGPADDR